MNYEELTAESPHDGFPPVASDDSPLTDDLVPYSLDPALPVEPLDKAARKLEKKRLKAQRKADGTKQKSKLKAEEKLHQNAGDQLSPWSR